MSLWRIAALVGALLLLSSSMSNAQTIEVPGWRCEQEGRYFAVRGEVKNISTGPLTLIAVSTFRTVGGKLVRYEKAQVEFNPLQPGQTSPFEMLTLASPEIAACELVFKEITSGTTIQVGGKLELPSQLPPLGDPRTGESLFNGKGVCSACHGRDGDSDQISLRSEVSKMNPKPTDLRNASTVRFKTNRERFRAIKYGIPGTAMVPMSHVSNDEIMAIIAYLDALQTKGK